MRVERPSIAARLKRADNHAIPDIIDALIEDSDGDQRKTIEGLLVLNRYLLLENERLSASVSPGFMRGSGGHRS